MQPSNPNFPIQLYLYGTSGCHLCDEAMLQIKPFVTAQICKVESVDIVSDPELYQRYEFMIPVLYDPKADAELAWPFTGPEVQLWLQSNTLPSQGTD
jgi:hypothetical protein